jgi:hypothetical protein
MLTYTLTPVNPLPVDTQMHSLNFRKIYAISTKWEIERRIHHQVFFFFLITEIGTRKVILADCIDQTANISGTSSEFNTNKPYKNSLDQVLIAIRSKKNLPYKRH